MQGETDHRPFRFYSSFSPQTTRRSTQKWHLSHASILVLAQCQKSVLQISARHEKGFMTGKLDEHAWQVQNSVTAIKRKLKQLAEAAPQIVPLSTTSTQCIEMFEEKQLMATQGMLREDISEERQRIAQLCWRLRNIDQLAQETNEDGDANEDEQAWAEK